MNISKLSTDDLKPQGQQKEGNLQKWVNPEKQTNKRGVLLVCLAVMKSSHPPEGFCGGSSSQVQKKEEFLRDLKQQGLN